MKKSLIALCITGALALAAYGDDDKKADAAKKHEATSEQKAARKAMIEKYDTNKDGKLDKDEKAKMSKEDKEKMKKAMGGEHKDSTAEKKEEKK